MVTVERRYPIEEVARRGAETYERDIRPQIEADSRGKIVAVDIETGDYEVADDTLRASEGLRQRLPDAQVWFVRVGTRAVYRLAA